MASKPVVHQAKGDAAEGKQKKNVGADVRNRRALGDIGNLVPPVREVEGKPQPVITQRPVTRSFRAQLLANAQAAAAENKRPHCVNLDGAPMAVDGGAAAKAPAMARPVPVQVPKKVTIKPKPEEVIEISPDTEEQVKQKPENKKKVGEGSLRRNRTLTSVLTARSKAACGLTDRPKKQIVDIDAADNENELAVVEYVDDIYKFYKEIENECRPHDYIDSQPEINEKMRSILVDWLIEVHNKFELMPETLYLTINLVDRFLSIKTVPRRELQLVGISAMLMASKYEEIWAPEVNDFVCISDRAYTHTQILVMEKTILGKLEWTLTVPTPYVFLVRFIKASIPDEQVENMVYFFAELALMHYDTIMYCPSMVAASAVYAARCTLNMNPAWNETLKLHTGFSEPQLTDCAKLLVSLHMEAADSKLKVVQRKYSSSERGAVALLPPAKALLATGAVKKTTI